jgi:hypothetical protein
MTRLVGEFSVSLPLDDALVACAEAIDGSGWKIETVGADRVVSTADMGAGSDPSKIELVLKGSGQPETVVRVTGTSGAAEREQLVGELNRIRSAIEASAEDATAAQGPPAGWYPYPDDREKLRYWDGRRWTGQMDRSAARWNPNHQ